MQARTARYLAHTTSFAALLVASAIGCGGTVSKENASIASAGSGGSAGNGKAGSGSAGSGNAAGTGNQCGGCPLIACGPDMQTIYEPGACCPSCAPYGTAGGGGEGAIGGYYGTSGYGGSGTAGYGGYGTAGYSDGGTAGTGPICNYDCPACPAGHFWLNQPGTCCGICVDMGTDCHGVQIGYQNLLGVLITPSTLACSTAADCAYLNTPDACADLSGRVVNLANARATDNALSAYSEQACVQCGEAGAPSTGGGVEPPPPGCFQGQCVGQAWATP